MTKQPLTSDLQHIQHVYPEILTGIASRESPGKRVERVVTDQSGHRWPITGLTCTACGWPLHHSSAAYGTHPTCDEETTP